jgi:hypothetical protein
MEERYVPAQAPRKTLVSGLLSKSPAVSLAIDSRVPQRRFPDIRVRLDKLLVIIREPLPPLGIISKAKKRPLLLGPALWTELLLSSLFLVRRMQPIGYGDIAGPNEHR